jgi:hypothetical protein
VAEPSRDTNAPVDFEWDCNIMGVPDDDIATVRQQTQQWITGQADGWDSGDHDIDFDIQLSGDNFTIKGVVEFNQDDQLATITECYGVNNTLPIQIYWDCNVEGVPDDYVAEVKGAVQQHVSEEYLNWDPGIHQIQFAMEIDDLDYDIQARVEFQDDPGAIARIEQCDGEEGAGKGDANASQPVQIIWDCQIMGLPPDYVGEGKTAVEQHITQAFWDWNPGMHEIEFDTDIDDEDYNIQADVQYQATPRRIATVKQCSADGNVTKRE